MSEKTINLYLVQDPNIVLGADARIYNENLSKHYSMHVPSYYTTSSSPSTPVQTTQDFIHKVTMEVMRRGFPRIKNMVIGSHGGYNWFYLGKEIIDLDSRHAARITSLGVLRAFFAKDANVYIVACKTGRDRPLLSRISTVLGGVKVHGYEERVFTESTWYSTSVDVAGREVVCLRNQCSTKDAEAPNRVLLDMKRHLVD